MICIVQEGQPPPNANARTTKASALAPAGASVYEIALPEGDLKLLAALRAAGAVSPTGSARAAAVADPLRVGARVVHASFGVGEIVAREGEPPGVEHECVRPGRYPGRM